MAGTSGRLTSPRLKVLVPGTAVAALLTACGAGNVSPRASTPTSGVPSISTTAAAMAVAYQLHMDFFSRETKTSPVIDPQVFVAATGVPAAVGPQMIQHAAGVQPARKDGSSAAQLLAADGSPLNVSLGQWEKAAGSVSFTCADGQERAVSTLSGLIPSASYSTFVVHLDVQGAGRFVPWGDPQGTTNNFTADAAGTATATNTVAGCLTSHDAALVVWHSDGRSHGATPGVLGVSWHNSLITPLP
ncbi:MAG: hypothetical protein NVSMB13_11960 [Mycobacteriales bacterium]